MKYNFREADRRVVIGRAAFDLSPIETRLFGLLFKHIGHALSRDEIESHVWGEFLSHRSRTLDTHISRLRQKLFLDGSFGLRLRALYTAGYRLESV